MHEGDLPVINHARPPDKKPRGERPIEHVGLRLTRLFTLFLDGQTHLRDLRQARFGHRAAFPRGRQVDARPLL